MFRAWGISYQRQMTNSQIQIENCISRYYKVHNAVCQPSEAMDGLINAAAMNSCHFGFIDRNGNKTYIQQRHAMQ